MSKNKKKKKKHYFGEREEEAVAKFTSDETPQKEKDKLYREIIHPAFEKMIRMLIFQRKIHFTGVDTPALISETQAHVWEKLVTSNFDPSKGKAYSYFTRTVLHYLYQKQMSKQRETDKLGWYSIDDDENYYIETHYEEPEDFSIDGFLTWYKKWLDEHIDEFFDGEDEVIIAHSIFNILQNDDVDIEHRRDFQYAISQLSGIDNNYKINKVLNLLKEKYFKVKDLYSKNREINIFKEFK